MKTLLIGVSVRAMAESAVRSHYAVIGLDAYGDRDLKGWTEAYGLLRDLRLPYDAGALFDASSQFDFDSVAYTSNLENHPEVLDRFAATCRVLGNSPQSVRSVRRWPELFARLEHGGFPVPETTLSFAATQGNADRTWLIKPVLSGGGHGVDFWQGRQPAGDGFMLQEFIPGKACSASFVANGSEAVLIGISEQLVGRAQFGAKGFRYCGNVLPLPEILDPGSGGKVLEQARRLSTFLTREFRLTGVNGFDFILDGERVVPLEVNPRYSASMELVERAYGLPVFHLHVEAVTAGRLPNFLLESSLKCGRYFGKAVLFCEKAGLAPDVFEDPDSDLRDIPMPGDPLREGGPICTILAWNPVYGAMLENLTRSAAKLKGQIYE